MKNNDRILLGITFITLLISCNTNKKYNQTQKSPMIMILYCLAKEITNLSNSPSY